MDVLSNDGTHVSDDSTKQVCCDAKKDRVLVMEQSNLFGKGVV
jgi:hypothetical protein